MKFSWEDFCKTHRIEYVTEGSSWTPGNISIKCPFCGGSDPGHHMGLSTTKPYWHCWRNDNHAGRTPHRLIMRLLGCGREYAENLVQSEVSDLSDFDALAADFLADGKVSGSGRVLELPVDFKPLKDRRGRAMRYFDYMVNKRKFKPNDVRILNDLYDIRYCDRCEFRGWKGRVIFPIYHRGDLVSWTGRTIYKAEDLRYRSLSDKPDKHPRGLVNVRDVLYNYDHAIEDKWEVCVLVEGVMDVLKIDYYGERYGICAVGAFGTGIRSEQINDLWDIRDNCKHLISCVDEGAELSLIKLKDATRGMGLVNRPLPPGVTDPGELSKIQVIELFKEFL